MKPTEIFTVSVRAYYSSEENGVNWKYLQDNWVMPLPPKKSSNSEVTVGYSNINNLGINRPLNANFRCSVCLAVELYIRFPV